MIKFFRQIRQRLLTENKFSKYLLYAIGEIVLVVIGILIALQVSNWNTNRLDSQDVKNSLNSLNAEFVINNQNLSDAIKSNENAISTGKRIMSIININKEELKTHNTDRLLFDIFEGGGSIEVTENSILEILQSNKLQKIRNDTLKILIFEWTQKKNKALSSKKMIDEKTTYLVNYLMKRYPLKNIDAFGVLEWKEPTTIKVDKHSIFYDIEFENIIDDLLFNIVNHDKRLSDLQETINAIVKHSETIYD